MVHYLEQKPEEKREASAIGEDILKKQLNHGKEKQKPRREKC
jgi:hypothetical protein